MFQKEQRKNAIIHFSFNTQYEQSNKADENHLKKCSRAPNNDILERANVNHLSRRNQHIAIKRCDYERNYFETIKTMREKTWQKKRTIKRFVSLLFFTHKKNIYK